jgi:hypothetical protein
MSIEEASLKDIYVSLKGIQHIQSDRYPLRRIKVLSACKDKGSMLSQPINQHCFRHNHRVWKRL